MDARLSARYGSVGAKILSAVECVGESISNQHELNGVADFRKVLGDERKTFPCRYVYFGESDSGEISYEAQESTITWYDARENHPTRSEYRLVYTSSATVMREAREGDFCWILTSSDKKSLTLVVAPASSRSANALDVLLDTSLRSLTFARPRVSPRLMLTTVGDASGVDLVEVEILQALKVEVSLDDHLLELVLARFGPTDITNMPPVRHFASFCRSICDMDDQARSDPDRVLSVWYDTTNAAYLAYERELLTPILNDEFVLPIRVNVDRFFELASSFKNRRFSRAGKTFEDHLAALLRLNEVRFDQPTTRLTDRSKPDFLMPGLAEFEDPQYPTELLTLLAAKTTAKERWAQIVSEGLRMRERHFATMDRQMSYDALKSMKIQGIIPVVPTPIQAVYTPEPRGEMLSMVEFISRVRTKEVHAVQNGLLLPHP